MGGGRGAGGRGRGRRVVEENGQGPRRMGGLLTTGVWKGRGEGAEREYKEGPGEGGKEAAGGMGGGTVTVKVSKVP
jgi:hypothetical protein